MKRTLAIVVVMAALTAVFGWWVLSREVFWVVPSERDGKRCWTGPGDAGTLCEDGMVCGTGADRCMVIRDGVVGAIRNPNR